MGDVCVVDDSCPFSKGCGSSSREGETTFLPWGTDNRLAIFMEFLMGCFTVARKRIPMWLPRLSF